MASVRWRLEKHNDECIFSQLESEFAEMFCVGRVSEEARTAGSLSPTEVVTIVDPMFGSPCLV